MSDGTENDKTDGKVPAVVTEEPPVVDVAAPSVDFEPIVADSVLGVVRFKPIVGFTSDEAEVVVG